MSSRATREDLPENRDADEYRGVIREATIEYLRDRTTREERKEIIKEALQEWIQAKFADLGWLSFKTVAAMVFAVVIYLWLQHNGWHKG